MVTNTANRPSHERVKQAISSQTSKKPNHEYSLMNWNCYHLAQWHNVWAFRTSGWTSGWPSGTLAHFIWQAGTITDPWQAHTNDETQLSQSGRLCWHSHRMMWSVNRCWCDGDVCGDSVLIHFLSQSRQLTSPHSENRPNPINRKIY